MSTTQNISKNTPDSLSPNSLPKWRLYMMKGLYLMTFLGLSYMAWAELIGTEKPLGPREGVMYSFWAAYAMLMGLGIRFPIKMLPLIFLQLIYKCVWVIGVYLPLKSAGQLDVETKEFFLIFTSIILMDIIVMPWSYVIKNFLKIKSS